MAKKPAKIKAKVIKRSPPKVEVVKAKKSSDGAEDLCILAFFGFIALLIHFAVNGFYVPFFGPKEIKEGQCYMNRSYKYVQVTAVYNSLNQVNFRDMEVGEIDTMNGAWYLTPVDDYKYRIERTKDFVQANYTEVPCKNFYVRGE